MEKASSTEEWDQKYLEQTKDKTVYESLEEINDQNLEDRKNKISILIEASEKQVFDVFDSILTVADNKIVWRAKILTPYNPDGDHWTILETLISKK